MKTYIGGKPESETDQLIKVVVESPFAADTPEGLDRNLAYARACMRDCFKRGEAPFASHLLYTQDGILDDTIPDERTLGIEAGLQWGRGAILVAVYTDLGITSGMQKGIDRARAEGREVEFRQLGALGFLLSPYKKATES